MASSKVKLYNKFLTNLANDVISLSNDSLKVALFTSASNAETLTLEFFNSLTNELASANGYTSGGIALSNISISESNGVTTITADNTEFSILGGDVTSQFAVLYSDTSVGKCLIGYFIQEDDPVDGAVDVITEDGQDLVIDWSNNILQLTADNS